MFAYPPQAAVDRVIPKNMIYKNARPSTAVKNYFISQVRDIVWKYKLSQDTINLSPKEGIREIQVFDITLKTFEFNQDILKTIDKAIPYPIFFRVRFGESVNRIIALKRPAGSEPDKSAISDYFQTGWQDAQAPEKPLPVALDLKSLYDQMLMPYIGIVPRAQEALHDLIQRAQDIRRIKRELTLLEAKMAKEIQFKRKIELNTQIRNLKSALRDLTF
jgi:hypothetical protein